MRDATRRVWVRLGGWRRGIRAEGEEKLLAAECWQWVGGERVQRQGRMGRADRRLHCGHSNGPGTFWQRHRRESTCPRGQAHPEAAKERSLSRQAVAVVVVPARTGWQQPAKRRPLFTVDLVGKCATGSRGGPALGCPGWLGVPDYW